MTTKTGLKLFFAAICVSMIAVTIKTSLQVSLLDALPRMVRDPWTVATFVDFYFNILIITSFVYFKNRSWWRTFLWLIAFVGLGSIATSAYVLHLLFQLKPNDSLDQLLVPAKRSS